MQGGFLFNWAGEKCVAFTGIMGQAPVWGKHTSIFYFPSPSTCKSASKVEALYYFKFTAAATANICA